MNLTRSTRLNIYKYAYDSGVNAALTTVEESKTYKKFKKTLEKALFKQIVFVVKENNYMDTLVMLAKGESPLENQIKAYLSYVLLEDEVDFPEYLVWAGTQGGQAAYDKLVIYAVFVLQNKNFIAYFNDYSNLLIKSVDDYTKRWIADKIQDGKNSGLSVYEIVDTIVSDGRDISRIRAERIVLTETSKAMATVELEAAKRAGIKDIKWRTSQDERVCPICGPLEGVVTQIGKPFSGTIYHTPAHVSCRCYMDEIQPTNWLPPTKVWLGD
jgi:SPP1 gp7 family putative phage head morphogenesis protein